jgi:hypothetical protein
MEYACYGRTILIRWVESLDNYDICNVHVLFGKIAEFSSTESSHE